MEKFKQFFTWQALLAIGIISVVMGMVYYKYIAPKIMPASPAA